MSRPDGLDIPSAVMLGCEYPAFAYGSVGHIVSLVTVPWPCLGSPCGHD